MTVLACSACVAVDAPLETVRQTLDHSKRVLSVPDISCAGCIRGIERALKREPKISYARVNFSLKRVTVWADNGFQDAEIVDLLGKTGFTAFPLNNEITDQSEDAQLRSLGLRIGVSGFAMMNVMLLSVAVWSGATDATRDLFHWISAIIAIPATLYSAQPFFKSALQALKNRNLNMEVPIAVAVLLALVMSLYETSASGHHAYFDAALSLTFFLLIGRFLDQRIKGNARSAARELAALEPSRVTIEFGGQQKEIKLSELRAGDIMFLPAGSRLAADGELVRGQSLIDLSFITGECLPEPSTPGKEIPAGAINLTGPIWVKAIQVGEQTTLQKISDMIASAEAARNSYSSLADRAAQLYAPVVHLLALVAFIFWIVIAGDARVAMNIAIAVLIITCPCALGLAVPAVNTAINSRLFRKGVLLKGDSALERLAEVDMIIFDKTGTLSEMKFDLEASNLSEFELSLLASLTQHSNHPISASISSRLSDSALRPITNVKETAGLGLKGFFAGTEVSLTCDFDETGAQRTVFSINGQRHILQFSEAILEGSVEMIQSLKSLDYDTVILSGDTDVRVNSINDILQTDRAIGEMTPEEKAQFVIDQAAKGRKPLMIGDGLNDSAALAYAHASIAPSSALDVSRTAADVLLLGNSLCVVPELLNLTKTARTRMIQNFWLAVAYNLFAIPMAFAGLVTPLIAALTMSASSVTVILNAARFPSR